MATDLPIRPRRSTLSNRADRRAPRAWASSPPPCSSPGHLRRRPGARAPEPSGAGPGRPHRGRSAANPAPPALPGAAAADLGGAAATDASLAQLDHNIGLWTANLTANPHDYLSATTLATLYHGRGRLTADLGDHQRALEAARTAIRVAPTYTPAQDLAAAILFTLHDFAGAFDAAQAVLATTPKDLGALATRFDAEVELGRLDDARADLARTHRSDVRPGHRRPVRPPRVGHRRSGEGARRRDRGRGRRQADDATPTDLGFYAYAVGSTPASPAMRPAPEPPTAMPSMCARPILRRWSASRESTLSTATSTPPSTACSAPRRSRRSPRRLACWRTSNPARRGR